MAKEIATEPLAELTVVQRIWRWFRSMRTALVLVLILAVASIIGTLLPQAGQNEAGIQGFSKQFPALSILFRVLGFFNVYGSWWFYLIIAMLFISLIDCIIPRTQSFISKVKSSPKTPANERFITNLQNKAGFAVPISPDAALEKVASVLRGKRFNVHRFADRPNEIYAEKGKYGDLGSLLFHYMFIFLLIGIIYGKTTGFDNYATVIEGQNFTENHFGYDSNNEGPLFRENHRNFKVRLDDFQVTYLPSGQPKDFISQVTVFENGKAVHKQKVEVNEKLVWDGVKIYQSSYGWAPKVAIFKNGKKVYDQPSIFNGDASQSQGQVQSPDGTFIADLFFLPDLQEQGGQLYPGSFYLNNPSLYVKAFTNLQGQEKKIFEGVVKLGKKKDLGGGYTLQFPEVKQWSGFQVVKDPGVPLIYTAFGIGILGLYITFYLSRRRIWAITVPGDGGKTKVLIGGLAEKNKGAFEFEFSNLTEKVKISLSNKGA